MAVSSSLIWTDEVKKSAHLNRPITHCVQCLWSPISVNELVICIIYFWNSAHCTVRILRKCKEKKMVWWFWYFHWNEKKTWSCSTLHQTTKLCHRKLSGTSSSEFWVVKQRKTESNQTETIKTVHSTVPNCKSFVLLWYWVNGAFCKKVQFNRIRGKWSWFHPNGSIKLNGKIEWKICWQPNGTFRKGI